MIFRRLLSSTTRSSPIKAFWKQMEACPTALELEQLVSRQLGAASASASGSVMNDVNLAKALTRLSELGSENAGVMDAVLARSENVKFKPGELMDMCVAISQLNTRRHIPPFITKQITLHTAMKHFKPRFFSFILFSYLEMNQKEPEMMTAMGRGLLEKDDLTMFGMDDFGIILDSLSAMGCGEVGLVAERVGQELMKREDVAAKMDTSDIALVWSALRRHSPGVMRKEEEALVHKFKPEIEKRLDEFSEDELVLMLTSSEEEATGPLLAELEFVLGEALDARALEG